MDAKGLHPKVFGLWQIFADLVQNNRINYDLLESKR